MGGSRPPVHRKSTGEIYRICTYHCTSYMAFSSKVYNKWVVLVVQAQYSIYTACKYGATQVKRCLKFTTWHSTSLPKFSHMLLSQSWPLRVQQPVHVCTLVFVTMKFINKELNILVVLQLHCTTYMAFYTIEAKSTGTWHCTSYMVKYTIGANGWF